MCKSIKSSCFFLSFLYKLLVFSFAFVFYFPVIASAAQVTLEWDENDETDLSGYRIYCRQEGHNYDYYNPVWEGAETNCSIFDLDENISYYFVVRAYNTSDLESGNSNEVVYQSGYNAPLTAKAGPDQTVYEGDTVILNGFNSSDPDDDITFYQWIQMTGTQVALSDTEAIHTTFTAPDVEGPGGQFLTFQLTVTDDDGETDTDTVEIMVNAMGATIIRINAGGGEYRDGNGNIWSADYGYNTEEEFSFLDPISGTTDDYLFQTERWDPSSSPELEYSFDVNNGDYLVNLYFADIYAGTAGVGLRVFDIVIEDELVLDDLDIYGEVGNAAALVKEFDVTVTDEQLNIRFLHQVEDPKISAIAIISQGIPGPQAPVADAGLDQTVIDNDGDGFESVTLDGSGSTDEGMIVSYEWSEGSNLIADGVNPEVTLAVGVHMITLTVTDDDGETDTDTVEIMVNAMGATIIRINAGGGKYRDGNGNIWSADYGYNTGMEPSFLGPISGTTDDYLFQTERWDPSSSPELEYSFDVNNGDYLVNLYFADIYAGTARVGLRVFDIVIEDELVLDDLDIYGEVGDAAALVKEFNVTVTDGQLNIRFLHEVENPKISAIEIVSE